MNKPLVSVLIPVFNEQDNIEAAYHAVRDVFEPLRKAYEWELVFTDNHSTDGSFEILREIAAADPRIRVIRFSRNFGYQKSLLFAHLAARGDAAIQLDCDLQDPVSLIPEFLQLWRQGYAVVYGIRRSRQEGWGLHLLRRAFYRLLNALSDDDLPLDAGDFRLVDRRVLDEMRKVRDATPYLRGLIATMGFRQVGIPYDRQARQSGRTKFGPRSLIRLSVDGFVNHSLVPLRIASFVALGMACLTALGIVVYTVGRLFFGQNWPAGFATTTVLILGSITLNAMFLGIIGEYLARIYAQVKQRPLVIVEQEFNDGAGGHARVESKPALSGGESPAQRRPSTTAFGQGGAVAELSQVQASREASEG